MPHPAVLAAGICIAAAALEGMCAGTNVKAVLGSFRQPPYSAPLWIWTLIGGGYYFTFGFILYRLLSRDDRPAIVPVVALIVAMMTANSLANYVIFRARNLRLNFIIGALAPIPDLILLMLISQIDRGATIALLPYLVYRVYGVWWCYALWQANVPE